MQPPPRYATVLSISITSVCERKIRNVVEMKLVICVNVLTPAPYNPLASPLPLLRLSYSLPHLHFHLTHIPRAFTTSADLCCRISLRLAYAWNSFLCANKFTTYTMRKDACCMWHLVTHKHFFLLYIFIFLYFSCSLSAFLYITFITCIIKMCCSYGQLQP